MTKSFAGSRKAAFAIFIPASTAPCYALQLFGFEVEKVLSFAALPALALYIWNRSRPGDHFLGMALPTTCLLSFISLGIVVETSANATLQSLGSITKFAAVATMLWSLIMMLNLRGPP